MPNVLSLRGLAFRPNLSDFYKLDHHHRHVNTSILRTHNEDSDQTRHWVHMIYEPRREKNCLRGK